MAKSGLALENLARVEDPAILCSPINAGAFCMLAGLVLVPVVSAVTKKPEQALVENAFSCCEHKVLVPQREALGEKQ